MIVRNNGGGTTSSRIVFLKEDGTRKCNFDSVISRMVNHTFWPDTCGTTVRSSVVDANQNVSVLAINDNGIMTEGYSGIPTTLTVAGIGTANTVYVPAYCCDYYDWDTSLYVQNTGTAQTTVTAQFYKADGTTGPSATATINPNGQAILTPACDPDPYNPPVIKI